MEARYARVLRVHEEEGYADLSEDPGDQYVLPILAFAVEAVYRDGCSLEGEWPEMLVLDPDTAGFCPAHDVEHALIAEDPYRIDVRLVAILIPGYPEVEVPR
jgi:hypothetical protein